MTTADSNSASNEVDANAANSGHEHAASRWDDVDVPMLLLSGFVSCVITYISIVGLQAFYYYSQNVQLERRGPSARANPVQVEIDRQKTILAECTIDKNSGEITIPVKHAMTLVLNDYKTSENQ